MLQITFFKEETIFIAFRGYLSRVYRQFKSKISMGIFCKDSQTWPKFVVMKTVDEMAM